MSENTSRQTCRKFKSPFSISVFALVAVGFVPAAVGQEADDQLVADTIIVTGTRLQNQQSIATKRDADGIVDSISQDEIGRQPDFNIADAVRRAPGVSTVRDEEEGLFLSVRGLNPDFTFVTLDGGAISSLDLAAARRVSVESLPSTVVSRTDISKTRDASMDGNTIGGQVNLVTRSAFDADGLYLVASGSVGKFTADNFDRADNDPAVRLDGTVSNTFGSADQFGIVLAGSYFRRDQDEERVLHFYDRNFTGPNFPIWNGIESPYERIGLFGKLEFRPSDQISMSLSALYAEQNETFERASNILGGSTIARTGVNAGTVTGNYLNALESLITPVDKQQLALNYALDYEASPLTQFSFRGSYSDAEIVNGGDERSDIAFSYIGPNAGIDYGYTFRGTDEPPLITFLNPGPALEPDNYALSRIRNVSNFNSGEALDLEGSVDHAFGDSGFDVRAGVRYRTMDRSFDTQTAYDVRFTGATRALFSQFGRFSSSYTAPGAPLRSPIIDNSAVLAFLAANPQAFTNQVNPDSQVSSDFAIEEEILAGYISFGYETDQLQANAGLRVEATDVSGSAFARVNGVYGPVSESNDYVNLLPSLGVSYDLTDAVKLRAAYSRALGRANLPDLNPARTVSESAGVTTISGGNINLDPRVSDNFDLSLEYYFDGGRSLASVAVFHKRIQDEIFRLSGDSTVNGAPVVTTQPVNAQEAELTGIELNLVKDRFDFLPGPLADFGLSANYTYISADSAVLTSTGAAREVGFLVEQPEHLANVALFYQRGPFEGRVSYNLTGEYANSIEAGNPDGDDFIAAFETVDAQARWRFSDNFTIIAEGRNLTNETNRELTGPNAQFFEDYSVFGRAYFIGLTYNY
jgi:iron complex outermembrane recepter protein